jgi:hypothetical protein
MYPSPTERDYYNKRKNILVFTLFKYLCGYKGPHEFHNVFHPFVVKITSSSVNGNPRFYVNPEK